MLVEIFGHRFSADDMIIALIAAIPAGIIINLLEKPTKTILAKLSDAIATTTDFLRERQIRDLKNQIKMAILHKDNYARRALKGVRIALHCILSLMIGLFCLSFDANIILQKKMLDALCINNQVYNCPTRLDQFINGFTEPTFLVLAFVMIAIGASRMIKLADLDSREPTEEIEYLQRRIVALSAK